MILSRPGTFNYFRNLTFLCGATLSYITHKVLKYSTSFKCLADMKTTAFTEFTHCSTVTNPLHHKKCLFTFLKNVYVQSPHAFFFW